MGRFATFLYLCDSLKLGSLSEPQKEMRYEGGPPLTFLSRIFGGPTVVFSIQSQDLSK